MTDQYDSTYDNALEEAALSDVPQGLIVRNPRSPLVVARRKQLTLARYQKQAHIQQLTDELAELETQLTSLGGPIGTYSDYAKQIQRLPHDATTKAMRQRRADALVSLSNILSVWLPVAVIGGVVLLIVAALVLLLVLIA